MNCFTKTFIVELKDTASAVGSGELEVLATPALLAMVEESCKDYLYENLADEETSVGTAITVKHLRPSKVSAEITVKVSIESQGTSKIDFSFEVYDNKVLIAVGSHQRAVVLRDAFLNKYVLFDEAE